MLDTLRKEDDLVLYAAEARITDELRGQSADAYKKYTVYGKFIEDLAPSPCNDRSPAVTKNSQNNNEVAVTASKAGHRPFCRQLCSTTVISQARSALFIPPNAWCKMHYDISPRREAPFPASMGILAGMDGISLPSVSEHLVDL